MRPFAQPLFAVALQAMLCLSAHDRARAGEPAAPAAAVESSATARTRLYVKTIPPGAQVTLDGQPLGPSDGLFLVPAGTAKVSVQFDGVPPQHREVEITEGRITRLEMQLGAAGPAAASPIPGAIGGGGGGGLPIPEVPRLTSKRPAVTPTPLSKLDARLLAGIEPPDFNESPLLDAVQLLRKSAQVEMLVDRRSLEEAGINLDMPITANLKNLSLAAALDALLAPHDLAWTVRDDIVVVTTSERAADRPPNHVHDVSDICDAAGVSSLIDLLQTCNATDMWDVSGGPGQIRPVVSDTGPSLIISQSWPVQWRVARFLAAYRALKAMPADARRPLASEGYWSDSAPAVAARAALDKPANAQFVETPLRDAIDQLAKQADVPIGLDFRALAEAGVDPDSPVTFALQGRPLAVVLDRMLEQLDLSFEIGGDRFLVTTREKSRSKLSAAFYPLPAGSDGQVLCDLIQSTVTPDAWDVHGGPGAIRPIDGDVPCLVVSQSTAGHRAVDAMLRSLPKGAIKSVGGGLGIGQGAAIGGGVGMGGGGGPF